MNQRSPKQIVLIILSALGFSVIFPFAIMRYIQGQWLIGIVDSLISIPMLVVLLYVIKTRKESGPSSILSAISMVGALVSAVILGEPQAYWIFPAVLATYYLIKPTSALVICSLASLTYLVIMYYKMDSIRFFTFMATLSISNLFAFVFSKSMHDIQAALQKLAVQDPLTGIGNRRALDQKLKEVVLMQQRTPSAVSLIMFDLDLFKDINDQHGHQIGDHILCQTVQAVKSRIRATDILFRFGGEEFVIVPLSLKANEAKLLAEELRKLIENYPFDRNIRLTISFGIAEFQAGESYHDWFKRADAALYRAKDGGRNLCCV